MRHEPIVQDHDNEFDEDLKVYAIARREPDDWIERIINAQHEVDDEEIKRHLSTSVEPWMHNGKLWVPSALQKELVKDIHESPDEGGHAGITRTIARVQETFGFAKIKDVVTEAS